MLKFSIDEDSCVKCGECVADCPYRILEMEDGGYPVVNSERADECIECQHCFAVCPTGALSIFGLDPKDSLPLKDAFPEPEKVERLFLGRRSIRRYAPETVDSELLDRLVEVVRTAPTGMNRRTTCLTLVHDAAAMDELRTRAYAGLRRAVVNGSLPPDMALFEGISNVYEKRGVDVLFRNAPHFLVTSAPAENRSGMTDGLIAMTYFELLAASHGLGTVWDGLAKWALLSLAPEALELLDLPEGHDVCYMMAFGKPAVKYHRTVQRPGGMVRKITL